MLAVKGTWKFRTSNWKFIPWNERTSYTEPVFALLMGLDFCLKLMKFTGICTENQWRQVCWWSCLVLFKYCHGFQEIQAASARRSTALLHCHCSLNLWETLDQSDLRIATKNLCQLTEMSHFTLVKSFTGSHLFLMQRGTWFKSIGYHTSHMFCICCYLDLLGWNSIICSHEQSAIIGENKVVSILVPASLKAWS